MASESVASTDITLDAESAGWVREALLIGLQCLGDVEKRSHAWQFAKSVGAEWPEDARPTHPTGTADCTAKFATALLLLNP